MYIIWLMVNNVYVTNNMSDIDLNQSNRIHDNTRYYVDFICTLISTFLVFKLNLICKCKCSTTGVNIFIQFSFNGVYLFDGTGTLRNSLLLPWN